MAGGSAGPVRSGPAADQPVRQTGRLSRVREDTAAAVSGTAAGR